MRRVGGQETRATVGATGSEQRKTQEQLLAGQKEQIGARGTEARLTESNRAKEQRATELQREQFRRYKEDRDYGQSQRAYRS